MDDNEILCNHCRDNGNCSKSCGFKFTASLGHGCLFFAYALKYNVSSVVVSKLGNIDGAYYSKVTLLLPNFETTWQGALFEGHKQKKDTHALPYIIEQIRKMEKKLPFNFKIR